MINAGFAEIDITPPLGTERIGWLVKIIGASVHDPLYARVAVFEAGGQTIGFIGLDTLSIRWTQVQAIRAGITARCGVPGGHVMVAATHNHAGPAVANIGDATRDDAYCAWLTEQCVTAFTRAWEGRQPARLGFGSRYEWDVAHNRRVVMRDGTVRTHGSFADPDALFIEGPIDPELSVVAAQALDGTPLGCLVNFSCHPTHLGGDPVFSAGFPGVMAAALKAQDWPVALYLNGACGNLSNQYPERCTNMEMDEAGQRLADDALRVIAEMVYVETIALDARSTTVQLPYRTITDAEVHGTVRGANRFIDPALYDRHMPALLERIRTRKVQPAELQALSLGAHAFVSIPGEYFVEHGLRIKTESYPRRTKVVATANGMVGYLPTKAAFERGGYETTFSFGHRMAPEAGDLLANTAIALLKAGIPDAV